MREIKFRAWHKNNSRMCDNVTTDLLNRDYLEFMQYTGLKDKNGKEIYEGDIINVLPNPHDTSSYRVEGKHVVEWWNGQFVFKANSTCEDDYINFGWWVRSNNNATHLKQIEAIGNIYENPELVEVHNA